MSNVHISHDPIVITNFCNALILNRACVQRSELTNHIAITNDQLSWLTAILHILRGTTYRSKVTNLVFLTNGRATFNNSVCANLSLSTNFDIRANNCIRSDFNALCNLRFGVNNGGWMYQRHLMLPFYGLCTSNLLQSPPHH